MNHDTPGYDVRGSAKNRRRRRDWLMSPASGHGGNHFVVPCHHCARPLTRRQMEVDRFPVCGHDGGRYTRDNIVPSCRSCNLSRCPACQGAVAARDGLHSREVGYIDTKDPDG